MVHRVTPARLARLGLLWALVFFAAGCAAGSAWPLLLSAFLSLGALAFTGCGESHSPRGDAETGEDGGRYETCCVSGLIDSCYCPGGAFCNYGWFEDCGEGTCVDPGLECPGADAGVDSDVPDAADTGTLDDGGYEPCCVEGVVSTCYCPPLTECNYGLFIYCDDGSCADPGFGECPDADGGVVDAGTSDASTPSGDAG